MHMKQGNITLSIQNHIATITFGHPASNSFPTHLLQQLATTFTQVNSNNDVYVIHLKSEGEKAFCAGASFTELIAIENESQGEVFFNGFANVINAMRSCKQPIIATVQGKTVGGGVGLLAACDHVVATEQALIKLSEFTIGIGPFVIAPAVERKIGKTAMAQLTLEASEWKSAFWALEKGLFSTITTTQQEAIEESLKLAQQLSTYNPEALFAMRKLWWKDTAHWNTLLAENAKITGTLVLSEFTKNALAKYKTS